MGEKQIIHLSTIAEATAFMLFLRMELNWHIENIRHIQGDIAELSAKWDIAIPDPSPDLWVEV